IYRPVLGWALGHRLLTLGVAGVVLGGALALVPRIGSEFMPPLNEGDLMFMPVTDPAISLPQAIAITKTQNAAIQRVPEVAEVVAKVFGNDLTVLQEKARAIADVLRTIPGAVVVYPEQVTGAPYLDIRPNRAAAARYGITVGAIQDVIETAVGETTLTLTIEGRQRFPIRVRYAPEYRSHPAAIGSVLVTAPNGTQVPLAP